MQASNKFWDLFICHASEDKIEIARPLAEFLRSMNLKVWYDEFSLTMGDSLRRSVEKGLNGSKYGLVILSPAFFEKEWPQKELDGLAAKEIDGTKVILPIWHNLGRDDVAKYSPMLADRIAAKTVLGLNSVVNEISRAIKSHIEANISENNDGKMNDSSVNLDKDEKSVNLVNDSTHSEKDNIVKGSDFNVVYFGPKYTFSHEAAKIMFPHAQLFFERSPQKLFDKVDREEMDYGVLPIENSSTGIVYEFYPLLVDQDFEVLSNEVHVHIVKEFYLPIFQHLLSRSKLDLKEIETIYTNRQPYLQCFDWIERNLSHVKIENVESTAVAAERLDQDPKGACIGGDFLAKEVKLIKIRERINDFTRNLTRFVAISAKPNRNMSPRSKTTFAIAIPDKVGALMNVLKLISLHKINLINIKTLPVKAAHIFPADFKDWFIIDVASHRHSHGFRILEKTLINSSDNPVLTFKFLGSYLNASRNKTAINKDNDIRKHGAEQPPKGSIDRISFFVEVINKGESETVEFKSSLRYDFKIKSANKELSKVIAKTLCGFMNSKGGYLFIGVSDDGEIIGIDEDIITLPKKNIDGFLSAFFQVVSDFLGKEFSQYIHTEIIKIKTKDVCCVWIEASARPVWMNDTGNPIFYIRVGNSTRPLDSKATYEHLISRLEGA